MPFAKKFNMKELLDTPLLYTKTKSIVTIEYIVWKELMINPLILRL